MINIENEIKQTRPFRSQVEKTIVNIVYTNNIINVLQNKIVKEYNISIQQYNVLRILKGQNKKPISINGIMERMLDKMSNASRLVDKLYTKGLVDRKQRETNRRALDVTITQKGITVLEEINESLEDFFYKNIKMQEEEFIQLNNLLDQFRNQVHQIQKD